MDATESAALGQLAERDTWPVDELPAEIDADVLRCLDLAELVEACSVVLVNRQKRPGDPTPPAPSQGRWFSPIKQPEMAGGWDRIRSAPPLGTDLPKAARVDVTEVPIDDFGGFFPKRSRRVVSVSVPKPVPSFYVRLNERGRAELARMRRRSLQPKGAHDGSRRLPTNPSGLRAKHSASPHAGDELLHYLVDRPDEMAAVTELPERFRSPDMLTVCDADGLIEFGRRNHCFVGPAAKSELRVERGWEFGSITGAGRKPMAQILGEALTFTGDDRIRPYVRLTASGRIRVARLTTDGAALPTESQSRKKDGGVKWQRAQKRMWGLFRQRKLPKTLRQAAKLLESEGFAYSTVRTAAHRSPTLTEHFNLTAAGDKAVARGGAIVDELAQQADRRTKQAIQRMSPQQRAKVEAELKDMPATDALELVKTLASDPDAGSTGDVAYIEEADQDDRDDDE